MTPCHQRQISRPPESRHRVPPPTLPLFNASGQPALNDCQVSVIISPYLHINKLIQTRGRRACLRKREHGGGSGGGRALGCRCLATQLMRQSEKVEKPPASLGFVFFFLLLTGPRRGRAEGDEPTCSWTAVTPSPVMTGARALLTAHPCSPLLTPAHPCSPHRELTFKAAGSEIEYRASCASALPACNMTCRRCVGRSLIHVPARSFVLW